MYASVNSPAGGLALGCHQAIISTNVVVLSIRKDLNES